MTNSEYLDRMKREDGSWLINNFGKLQPCYEYRKTKALEIIAEELIKLNKRK